MTTSYERLREECNKRLPDLLELKFGCEFIATGPYQEDGKRVITFGVNDERAKYPYRPDGKQIVVESPVWCGNCGRGYNDEYTVVEILGTPLTITDVLRVLYTREDFITLRRGKLCLGNWKSPDGRWTEEGTQEPICFDLSLPLSAPENEAACEAVLSIITETV